MEEEYCAIAHIIGVLQWFCGLFRELCVYLLDALTIFTNSRSTLFMISNSDIQAKMRPIEIDYHYVLEFIAQDDIRIRCVHSHDQMVDMSTKSLPTSLYQCHRQRLGFANVIGLY